MNRDTYWKPLDKMTTRKPDPVELVRDMFAKGEAAGPEALAMVREAALKVFGHEIVKRAEIRRP